MRVKRYIHSVVVMWLAFSMSSLAAVFNVKTDGGAAGNGTTDDTSSINAAITTAKAQGKDLYFPAGTYKVSGNISLKNGVSLLGDSAGVSCIKASVFKQLVDAENLSNIDIQDLFFLNTGMKLTKSGNNQVHVKRCVFALSITDSSSIFQCDFRAGSSFHMADSIFMAGHATGNWGGYFVKAIKLVNTESVVVQYNLFGIDLGNTSWLASEWPAYSRWNNVEARLESFRSDHGLLERMGEFGGGMTTTTCDETLIDQNIFHFDLEKTEVAQDSSNLNTDHIIYLKGSTNYIITRNWMSGHPLSPGGGLKTKFTVSGENVIAANYFNDTPLLMYSYNAASGLGLDNQLIYKNVFKMTASENQVPGDKGDRVGIYYDAEPENSNHGLNNIIDSNIYDVAPSFGPVSSAVIDLHEGTVSASTWAVYESNQYQSGGTINIVNNSGSPAALAGASSSSRITPYVGYSVPDKTIPAYGERNSPPVFDADPVVETNALADAVYSGSIADNATDDDGDLLTFSKISGPAWLIVATNGVLSGTPGAGDVGLNNWTVQVSDGIDTNSATLSIGVYYANGDPFYPPSSADDSSYEWISNVTIGSIDRSSGDDGGYYDATVFSTTETKGGSVPFSLAKGIVAGNDPYYYYWRIWIDLNHDGDFVDADELVYSLDVASSNTVTDTFMLPTTHAYTGPTRMRVSMKWENNGVPTSEEIFPYGEVEDYTINMAANNAPAFTSNPVIEADATEDAAYSGTIADNASDDDSDPLGFSKLTGPGWLNVATNGVLSGTPASEDVGTNSWTVQVSDGVDTSSATLRIIVYYANGDPFYPVSKGNDSSYEWISNVTIGAIDRSSGDDGGYYNATSFSTTESKGSTIPFSLTKGLLGGEPYFYYWRIWIDLNHDGDFVDADELVYSTPVANSNSVVDSFTLPATYGFAGSTRMRVSMKWDADGVPTSTETFPYGEVEDYTINITDSNSAPVFDSDPVVELSATKGAVYSSTIADDASDGDDNSMSFDKVSGPSWLSVAGSGVLSGTPIASDIGSNSWSVLVTDGVATNTGTLEILVNSDGDWDDDGIPDAWELDYFGHETNAVGSLDSDEDGQNNEAEFIAGFDPTNPASFFAITGFDMLPGSTNCVLSWESITNRSYDVLWANSLTGSLSTVQSNIVYPQGSTTSAVDQVESAGFYQLQIRRIETP